MAGPLKEWQLDFERMLGSVRRVGAGHELEIVNFAQGFQVNWHTAEWCLEGIVFWSSNAAHGDIMCRPNQHDADDEDRVLIILKRCKCCCSDVTGIDVASMRRDQCFGRHLRRAYHSSEQV